MNLEFATVHNDLIEVDSAGFDLGLDTPITSNKYKYRQELKNLRRNSGLTFSFVEPLNSKLFAEFNYSLITENAIKTREVYDLDTLSLIETPNQRLSNDYETVYLINRYNLNLQFRQQRINYMLGISLQPTTLKGVSSLQNVNTRTSNNSWAPTAHITYRSSRSMPLTTTYNGNYAEPDFQKMQPITDSTNTSNILKGNPELRPEFTNRISCSYSAAGKDNTTTLSASALYERTLNKIINSIYNDPKNTSRIITYINDNGFYRMSANVAICNSFNALNIKAVYALNGNLDNSPSIIDGKRINAQGWTLQPTVRLLFDLPEKLDAEFSGSYTLVDNAVTYNSSQIHSAARTFAMAVSGRFLLRRDLCICYSYEMQQNTGFSKVMSSSPNIINAYIEYRFLHTKSATIRVQGFDLLNQNAQTNRSIIGLTVIDNAFTGTKRYGIATLSWRLSKFTK